MKIYIEHKINSEADLPKEVGVYLGRDIQGIHWLGFYPDSDLRDQQVKYWIEDVDWYLEPVEISDGAEEILTKIALSHERKYASFPALIENESSVDVYEMIITAMQEFATIQVSKDRAEHLLLEVKTQPTDEDIEEWANAWDETTHHEPWVWSGIRYGIKIGAKAALSGEIKKKCQE